MPEPQPTVSLPAQQLAEEWRPVVGWEGLYEVSNIGRVRSLGRTVRMKDKRGCWHTRPYPGKLLSTAGLVAGYPHVQLHRNGKPSPRLVHQLVARAFLGPPPTPDHEVNHKHPDGDKTRCCVDNLEWVTRSENLKHARRVLGVVTSPHTLHCAREASAKLTEAAVREIRTTPVGSSEPLARRFGVTAGAIRDVRRRRTWKHVA